jgi:hypothetical protein
MKSWWYVRPELQSRVHVVGDTDSIRELYLVFIKIEPLRLVPFIFSFIIPPIPHEKSIWHQKTQTTPHSHLVFFVCSFQPGDSVVFSLALDRRILHVITPHVKMLVLRNFISDSFKQFSASKLVLIACREICGTISPNSHFHIFDYIKEGKVGGLV